MSEMERERRIAWDGIAYTWEEFFEEYGREASDFWADAPDAAEHGAPLAAGNSGAATERTEAPQVAAATGNNGAATELTEEPIPASGSDPDVVAHIAQDPNDYTHRMVHLCGGILVCFQSRRDPRRFSEQMQPVAANMRSLLMEWFSGVSESYQTFDVVLHDDYLPLHGLPYAIGEISNPRPNSFFADYDPLCPYDNERLAVEEADALDVDFGQEWYRG